MSIPNITGTAAISATASVAGASTPAVEAVSSPRATASHDVEIDRLTQQPVPPRFPWLSRLSQQLESASGQRQPFDPAPVLGDHIDRAA